MAFRHQDRADIAPVNADDDDRPLPSVSLASVRNLGALGYDRDQPILGGLSSVELERTLRFPLSGASMGPASLVSLRLWPSTLIVSPSMTRTSARVGRRR
jgi:hypothetical protein